MFSIIFEDTVYLSRASESDHCLWLFRTKRNTLKIFMRAGIDSSKTLITVDRRSLAARGSCHSLHNHTSATVELMNGDVGRQSKSRIVEGFPEIICQTNYALKVVPTPL